MKHLQSKFKKHIIPIDFTDELLKEKQTFESISKSDQTQCKNVIFPSIERPTELPPQLLQEKGIEIGHSRELPSLTCISDYRIAVL